MAKYRGATSSAKLKMLDWQDSVFDKDLNTPLGSPAEGDRYIVAASASDAWASQEGKIAEYNGSTWKFTTPNEGFACWIEDENKIYAFNGSAWIAIDPTGAASAAIASHESSYDHTNLPANDEKDALAGTDAPSGANPYATKGYSDQKLERTIMTKLKVLRGSDDGEEDYDTSWYPNGFGSNQISAGNDNTGSCDVGLRFLRAFIPNNAKITNAVLRVRAAVNSTKRPTLKVKGILQAGPNTFAGDGSDRPSTRTKTTAAVDWDIAEDWVLNTWYQTPNIASVINELIQQAEFTGKALALTIEDDGSPANQYENIWDFNSGAANAAELILTIEPNVP